MVKTHVQLKRTALMLVAFWLLLFGVSAVAGAGEKVVHPELNEQERLIDCAECHKDATPAVEKEWNDSVHGIAMVKCYQCHGTFETFVVEPARESCGTCHADKLENHAEKEGKVANTPCWECHVPHSFQVKK